MSAVDDAFELYDLRVEAVIPEGKPDLLRRKDGRPFRAARRDAVSMPAGQGFSIYSHCRRAAAARRQAARDPSRTTG